MGSNLEEAGESLKSYKGRSLLLLVLISSYPFHVAASSDFLSSFRL